MRRPSIEELPESVRLQMAEEEIRKINTQRKEKKRQATPKREIKKEVEVGEDDILEERTLSTVEANNKAIQSDSPSQGQRPSYETKAALKDIRYKTPTEEALEEIRYRTPTEEALDMVRETAESSDAPEVIAQRNQDKEDPEHAKAELGTARQNFIDEAEEVNDLERIRNSIKVSKPSDSSEVQNLDAEIKAGFASAANTGFKKEKSTARPRKEAMHIEPVVETEEIKNARMQVEYDRKQYGKLYAEYDPKGFSKSYADKSEPEDMLGAYDLVTVTKPPLRAVFTDQGRKLREAYGQLQKSIQEFNDKIDEEKNNK